MKKINAKNVMFMITIVVFIFLSTTLFVCGITTNILNGNLRRRPTDLVAGFCATSDAEPPVITLNGNEMSYILINGSYEELGATAVDDCDEINLVISGEVDTTKVGSYIITYSAMDNSGNIGEVRRTVNIVPEHRGTIYLTFDDGPSVHTSQLLDVLAKYNVKATFFVTGSGDDAIISREYNDGHTIGLHTFTHNYSYIYQNMGAFFDDLDRIQTRVKNITGHTTNLIRFPGGSSNTVSKRYDGGKRIMSQLVGEVGRRGFYYFDWNISSGDAEGSISSDAVYSNVVNRLGNGEYVVLQHDTKDFSVEAVERIIQYGLSNGYDFAGLDSTSYAAHHRINN